MTRLGSFKIIPWRWPTVASQTDPKTVCKRNANFLGRQRECKVWKAVAREERLECNGCNNRDKGEALRLPLRNVIQSAPSCNQINEDKKSMVSQYGEC